MGFHSYARPADYVVCHHTARYGIYGDDNLTGGAVRIKFGYVGGPVEDSFSTVDSVAVGTVRIPEVGGQATPDNLTNPYRWTPGRGSTSWGISGGKAYNTDGFAFSLMGLSKIGGGGITGRTDADYQVDVSAVTNAGLSRSDGGHTMSCMLDMSIHRVKVSDDLTGTMFTGSTVLTPGVTYTLRIANTGPNYSVYLNGVLEGTFSESHYSVLAIAPGIYANPDGAARFDNFLLRKVSNPVATTYTLRNYAGDIIKTGAITGEYLDIADSDLTVDGVAGHKYGWYRLYLTGPSHADGQWGTAYGDCSFIRIPPYGGFPSNGMLSDTNVLATGTDEVGRGVMALGINRYNISDSAAAAATTIAALTPAVTKMKTWWIDNADAARPRKTLVAFPNGTPTANAANITAIVNGLKTWVKVWESHNEPNFAYAVSDVASYITNEQAPFYSAVKAADSTAVVIAPNTVSFQPVSVNTPSFHGPDEWFRNFLQLGGDAVCDAYSIHPYNCYNGDLTGMRMTLGYLQSIIAAYGDTSKDIYQTEQGFGHAYAGQYVPKYAARWTALMVFAQEVLTLGKMRYENSFYWYDIALGFDNFPFQWLTPAGPGPQPCAIRTQAAETRGKVITSELDFGTPGKDLYCGGVWTNGSTGDKVVGVIAGSSGADDIRLAVTGASSFTRVDSWGNQTTINVIGGYVTFPVSELGCWLRVPNGTTAALVPGDWSWGANSCVTGTGTAFTNSPIAYPAGGTDYSPPSVNTYWNLAGLNNGTRADYTGHHIENSIIGGNPIAPSLLNDGFIDGQGVSGQPLIAGVTFTSRTLNRFVLWCQVPWHQYGTLMDFDLQTFDGSTWTTRHTWTKTSKSFAFAGADRCTSEVFWDEQWIFKHDAGTPITNCQGVRCYARAVSYGGWPDKTTNDRNDNGQGGFGYYLWITELQAFNISAGGGGVTPPALTGRRTSGAILVA